MNCWRTTSMSAARAAVAVRSATASSIGLIWTIRKMKKDGGYAVLSYVGRCRSDSVDVRRLKALRPLDQIELDLSSFRKRAEALGLDRGEVDENVLSGLRGDEAKALRIVEPLDFTGATHTSRFSF